MTAQKDLQKERQSHSLRLSRAASTVAKASTMQDAESALNNQDVVNIICGPMETEVRKLRRQLKEEQERHKKTKR